MKYLIKKSAYYERTFLVLTPMKNILLAFFATLFLASCQNTPSEGSTNDSSDQKNVATPPASSLDSINELLSNDELNAKKLALRAKVYLRANNVNAARIDIGKAYVIDSNLAVVYEARGEMSYLLNKGRAAQKDWEKCIKIDPKNSNCLLSLTELYITVQEYEKALKMVNRQLEIDDKDPQAYFMKGIIIRDFKQDTGLALQYFQNAVDLKQDYIEALDMLGVTLANRGDTLAPFYYKRILDQQPQRWDIYYKLGAYYMNKNEENRALEAFTKATQINPADAESYYSMGYIHLTLRQFAKARDLFTQSINARDRNYKAYYGRGYSHEMLGDVINAKKDYQRAIKALPQYTPAVEALERISK